MGLRASASHDFRTLEVEELRPALRLCMDADRSAGAAGCVSLTSGSTAIVLASSAGVGGGGGSLGGGGGGDKAACKTEGRAVEAALERRTSGDSARGRGASEKRMSAGDCSGGGRVGGGGGGSEGGEDDASASSWAAIP